MLDDAIDQVDVDVRDAVAAAVDTCTAITTALIEATDEEVAGEEVEQIIRSAGPTLGAASPWILDTRQIG